MSRKKVLVLGGNFGGLTATLAVKHELHGDVDATVVSASDQFLFNPSLIWLPFGKRKPSDITFPLAPTFESHDVEFVHGEATALDLAHKKVETNVAWVGRLGDVGGHVPYVDGAIRPVQEHDGRA